MTQSGYIAGALLLGFVVYLAAKNRLGVYAGVLWGAGGSAGTAGGNSRCNRPQEVQTIPCSAYNFHRGRQLS